MVDMFDRLEAVEKHYEEMNQRLSQPEIVQQQERYCALMKEFKMLTPIVESFSEYKKFRNDFLEAKELLQAGSLEKDFREMVQQQYEESQRQIEEIEKRLQLLLLPKDPNDEKNVIIEIRGGAGGEEAALFAADLFRMYTIYAQKQGLRTEVLNANETEIGGFKEVSFEIEV